MLWSILLWLTLVGEVALVLLAIRLYRLRRTRAFALFMWSCICFAIARTSWFTFGFFTGFIFPQASRAVRTASFHWQDYTSVAFQALSVALLLATVILFLRERSSGATPSV